MASFQLHVMDSYYGLGVSEGKLMLVLSTPCNGFFKKDGVEIPIFCIYDFQLHVMDS